MADKVKVLLLENVTNVGQAGDIISVAEGYARNFLFPQGKAALATDKAENQAAAKKAEAAKQAEQSLQAVQKQADQLDGTELTITARVKDGDQIFGKVTAANISKELSRKASIDVKAKDVVTEPITKLGSYDVAVRLSADIETQIKVAVVPDPDSIKDDDEE